MSSDKKIRELHVFFVASPIIQIVTFLVISALKLNPDNVLILIMRDADTSLIMGNKIRIQNSLLDKFLCRYMKFTLSDLKLRKYIESECDKFYVYTTWFDRTTEFLVNSSLCSGHYYMEEGQLAYYKNKEFHKDDKHSARQRVRFKASGSNDYHYRSDALGYFGTSDGCFPRISKDRKRILNNFSEILANYSLKLKGVKNIGVLPSPHRLLNCSMDRLVGIYLEKIGEDGVIKTHPGFAAYPKLLKSLKEEMVLKGASLDRLCGNEILLELEMLGEHKKLYGTRSSMLKYAEISGSSYEFLEIPGYLPPVN